MSSRLRRWVRYVRSFTPPILLWCLVVVALIEPLQFWLHGHEKFDEAAIREWIEEARVFRETLPEMSEEYLKRTDLVLERAGLATSEADEETLLTLDAEVISAANKRTEIGQHLKALGNPPTKMFPGQLPLFPIIYRIEVRFDFTPTLSEKLNRVLEPVKNELNSTSEPTPSLLTEVGKLIEPVVWDSDMPRPPEQGPTNQYRILKEHRLGPRNSRTTVTIHYQLHTFGRQQQDEHQKRARSRWLTVLVLAATGLTLGWLYLVQHRERERERQRLEDQKQIAEAEQLRLKEEIRRQDAEKRHKETERRLLEQELATQAAERQALELKSQLYASIGIMAGSYAHNIKNLLVRPNDLLSRCLEAEDLNPRQTQMLHEVRDTLGTVTERLQQILRTVRRDPSRSEMVPIDLNAVARDIFQTWQGLGKEKWKLQIGLETASEPLWIRGDASHLQQAAENLVFNARDATFEMRNHLRDQAHRASNLSPHERRQALLTAAGWRGEVMIRVVRSDSSAVLEVTDNGVGMTDEVKTRCTETHFSTKRDNALFGGLNTGMGLGLSFVTVILQHHHARLEIETEHARGSTMRAVFPIAGS